MPNDPQPLDHARLDLDSFVPYRLSVLTNRMSDAIARLYSDRFELSIAEWRVMAVLGQTPGLSAREVASRTAMDKVQVSRAVAGLTRKRRVARIGDASDGRITRLSLTTQGTAIYDEIVPIALQFEAAFLSALTQGERSTFIALLDKLARRVRGLHIASP